MSKIKVLHCLGALNAGGAETLVMNIYRNIDREKYEFDFLLFNQEPGFYDQEAKKLGSKIYYLPSLSEVGIFNYIKNIEQFFKEHQVDVVHSHMDWLGGFISYGAYKAKVKKRIVHSHADQSMFKVNFLYKLLINLNKSLISKYSTDRIACSTEAGKSLFKNDFDVLINGIDFKKFQNPDLEKVKALKEEFHIKENDIVLGHVGSFSENKNQSFLIKLLYELRKENKNYRLILVGDGNMRNGIEKLCKKFNVQDYVTFAGTRKEISEFMNIFDIFLFPSLKEGLGIVAIEAQVSGTNCVLSDTIPNQVDMHLGLVNSQPLHLDKWIEAVKKIKSHKLKYKNDIINNSEFSIEEYCKKLMYIYEREN